MMIEQERPTAHGAVDTGEWGTDKVPQSRLSGVGRRGAGTPIRGLANEPIRAYTGGVRWEWTDGVLHPSCDSREGGGGRLKVGGARSATRVKKRATRFAPDCQQVMGPESVVTTPRTFVQARSPDRPSPSSSTPLR